EIWEGLTKVHVELSHACFVGAGSRLCGVIHEIVGKELLKYIKVPFALNFLRIPAHDRFCRCRYCILIHSWRPLRTRDAGGVRRIWLETGSNVPRHVGRRVLAAPTDGCSSGETARSHAPRPRRCG